jgi:hypothetical protein
VRGNSTYHHRWISFVDKICEEVKGGSPDVADTMMYIEPFGAERVVVRGDVCVLHTLGFGSD